MLIYLLFINSYLKSKKNRVWLIDNINYNVSKDENWDYILDKDFIANFPLSSYYLKTENT